MADADTVNKRASAVGVSSPVPRLEQTPIGVIQHLGRHMAAFLYTGIKVHVRSPTFSGNNGSTRQLSTADTHNLLDI